MNAAALEATQSQCHSLSDQGVQPTWAWRLTGPGSGARRQLQIAPSQMAALAMGPGASHPEDQAKEDLNLGPPQQFPHCMQMPGS